MDERQNVITGDFHVVECLEDIQVSNISVLKNANGEKFSVIFTKALCNRMCFSWARLISCIVPNAVVLVLLRTLFVDRAVTRTIHLVRKTVFYSYEQVPMFCMEALSEEPNNSKDDTEREMTSNEGRVSLLLCMERQKSYCQDRKNLY